MAVCQLLHELAQRGRWRRAFHVRGVRKSRRRYCEGAWTVLVAFAFAMTIVVVLSDPMLDFGLVRKCLAPAFPLSGGSGTDALWRLDNPIDDLPLPLPLSLSQTRRRHKVVVTHILEQQAHDTFLFLVVHPLAFVRRTQSLAAVVSAEPTS